VMSENDKAYQVFVKPVGSRCNIRCSYCYYLGRSKLNYSKERVLMPDRVLEQFIIQNFESSAEETITFSWHGGEPLLAGLPFFKKVTEIQKRHLPAGKKVLNGIQTNGTLVTDEYCRFLSANKFIAGISIDGPMELHDCNRANPDGRGTFARSLHGYELLRKYNIPTEVLCVVNSENVRYPLIIYDFFRKLGVQYITFLPLVNLKSGSRNEVSRNSVVARDFGFFLCAIFDEWVGKDIGRIKVQIFEEMIRPAFHQEHTLCIFRETCGRVPVVEFNGDFYACDHFVDKDHLVGNIMSVHLSQLLESEHQQQFGKAKSALLPGYCRQCNVRPMCNGECPKNRFLTAPDGEYGLNYLCEGYKYFFNHCLPFIEAVGEAWKIRK
jgi:uncharacterized protein